MIEKWKDIDDFRGYQVSSVGNVRSYKDCHGNVTHKNPRMLSPRRNPNGYRIVTLYDDHRQGRQVSVHRLVAKAFIPNDDDALVVDHLDGNKENNAVTNLEWVTSRENSLRAYNAGLYEAAFAETRRPVIVTDIRNGEIMYFDGVNEAARKLGYSAAAVSKAANAITDTIGHYAVEFAGHEDRLLYGYLNCD